MGGVGGLGHSFSALPTFPEDARVSDSDLVLPVGDAGLPLNVGLWRLSVDLDVGIGA